MFDIQSKLNKNHIHFFFLFILSLNYLVPYILFNKITLFYHDALDSEIVYNHIIGKYLSGDSTATNLFLNGEVKFDYLRRIYQPIIFLYAFFETELAYWITDILVKLTSYISFFILSKKINNDIVVSSLAACLFATLNVPTHNGLGIAVSPYLIYLTLYKQNISYKNILIIIFFGLNSDLIFTIFATPFLIFTTMILSSKNLEIFRINFIKVFGIFFITILIGNLNLILLGFSDQIFHREEFVRTAIPASKYLITFFSYLFSFTSEINFDFFNQLPEFFLLVFLFPLILFSKQNKIIKILILIIFIQIFLIFLSSKFYIDTLKNSYGLLSTLNLGYCATILPLLYCIASLMIFKIKRENLSNFFKLVVFVSILIGQSNSSIIPFYKKFIVKENNYRNIYTFEEFYLFEDYKKIKVLVKDKRVASIGLDPMIAVANDIKTIDGYHNIYPLSYKKKFRKLIEKELNQNDYLAKYYDHWGSRVYMFNSNPDNILINFNEVKKLGADFVISKYNIQNQNLALICKDCSKYFKLYSIN